MPDLLFEIGAEELPAAYVTEAEPALRELAAGRLAEARLPAQSIESFATPRRLAIRALGLPAAQERLETRRRGPAAAAAYRNGEPTPAAVGFARSSGVDVEALEVSEGYVYARSVSEGRPAHEVLPGLLAGLVRDLPAGRKMRWGEVDTEFVRPVSWLLARLDGDVVPVAEAGVTAGGTTRGHRILADKALPVPTPADYEAVLDALHVIPGSHARREAVLAEAKLAVALGGLELAGGEELLEEVANLVETPFAVVGGFEERFLELPDEVLATVMIHHQRFFPVKVPGGRLANRFVAVSNTLPPDPDVVRTGYEAVLAGRLSDAGFFWRADTAKPLSEHRERLSGMAFQKGLGSLLDKAERVGVLAPRLAGLVGGVNSTTLNAALPLFKADLGTAMVYELPELAGVMGRAYAEREGAAPEVAGVLEEGVKPLTATAELPATPEGAVAALADRLDTLVGFFSRGGAPTGSADPFGLRRAGLGAVRILAARGWDVPLAALLEPVADAYREAGVEVSPTTVSAVATFLHDRLEGLLETEGLDVREVRAARGSSDSVTGVARRAHLVHLLRTAPDFEALAELYKRAANITKGVEVAREIDSALLEPEFELPLYKALPRLERGVEALLERAQTAFGAWDVGTGITATGANLKGAVADVVAVKSALDRFLDKVLVNAPDEQLRQNRLTMLARVRDAVRRVAHLEALS